MNLKMRKSDEKLLPSVSVVVPAFNSEKTIGQTIESLVSMDYPRDKLEVIIVDDASTDETAEVALNQGVKVVKRQKKGGCAAAKNTGVASAKNEIVAFIDADVTVAKNWLRKLVSPFQDPAVGAVGGLIKNKFRRSSVLERFTEYDNLYRRREKDAKSVSGSNSAYRREVFKVVGGLDPYLGEDPDFCYRVSTHGYRLIFNEKAVVYHPFPNSLSAYLKKQVYYAWQRMLILLLRPKCRSNLVKDEITPLTLLMQPPLLAAMILSLFLIPTFDIFRFIFVFLLLAWIVMNIPFLRYVHNREQKMTVFALLFSFVRSFAYVVGMATGLVSFLKIKVKGKPKS